MWLYVVDLWSTISDFIEGLICWWGLINQLVEFRFEFARLELAWELAKSDEQSNDLSILVSIGFGKISILISSSSDMIEYEKISL